MATYLDLPPNMGGTQFGPFQGTIQIGTDPAQCQIVLNQQMGIAPVHVQVVEQGEGYMIAPVQRGFGLFLARSGGGNVQPVAGATPAAAGDAVILGNPGGPRFTIRRVAGSAGVGSSAAGARGGSSMGDRVAKELWRQQTARLMARNPMFRDFQRLMFRYRSGALTNPRVLVGLIGTVVALIIAGAASCGGLIAAMKSGIFGN